MSPLLLPVHSCPSPLLPHAPFLHLWNFNAAFKTRLISPAWMYPAIRQMFSELFLLRRVFQHIGLSLPGCQAFSNIFYICCLFSSKRGKFSVLCVRRKLLKFMGIKLSKKNLMCWRGGCGQNLNDRSPCWFWARPTSLCRVTLIPKHLSQLFTDLQDHSSSIMNHSKCLAAGSIIGGKSNATFRVKIFFFNPVHGIREAPHNFLHFLDISINSLWSGQIRYNLLTLVKHLCTPKKWPDKKLLGELAKGYGIEKEDPQSWGKFFFFSEPPCSSYFL